MNKTEKQKQGIDKTTPPASVVNALVRRRYAIGQRIRRYYETFRGKIRRGFYDEGIITRVGDDVFSDLVYFKIDTVFTANKEAKQSWRIGEEGTFFDYHENVEILGEQLDLLEAA